jgi:Lrp/AsnC family leucine-responsive transcriptional regulator
MKTLDDIDRKILDILQEDSMISVKDIAQQVGLSFSPTYERIRAMKQAGIIVRYVAILDPEKVGFEIMSYCNITLKEQSGKKLSQFEDRIREEPNVLEVISLSGTYDYMIKVVARNIKEYNAFLTTVLANMPNVGQYHSHIVLEVVKDETKLTLT